MALLKSPCPLIDYAKAEATTAGAMLLRNIRKHSVLAGKIDTENEEVFFNLGFALSRLGRDAEAIRPINVPLRSLRTTGRLTTTLAIFS